MVQACAMWLGEWPLALVLGLTAALAAGQIARTWSEEGERPDLALSLLIAGLVPLAATVSTRAVGALIVSGVVVSILGASVQRRPESPPIRDAAFTVQSWLPVGLGSASMVLVFRSDAGGAVWLLCLVAIYDAGSYLIGADSSRIWTGPLAGLAGVGVAAFALTVLGVPPFDSSTALRFGVAAALLLPAGVAASSAILPHAGAKAPVLRTVDSMLLVAPIWAWAISRYVASLA